VSSSVHWRARTNEKGTVITPPTAGSSLPLWPQPLAPVHSVALSALVAAIPLAVVLLLMGGLRKSGLLASACGLAAALLLAVGVWGMPAPLAGLTLAYGWAFALWSILWIVFNGLWLYNLAADTGSFGQLRRWMASCAPGDRCVQAVLVAFCFGALLEGSAGFGAPVAITAFLLVGLGFQPRLAVLVCLIANTAPVAFGAIGVPVVALAGVTGLDVMKLSAMVGRQLPFLSLALPAYLVWVVGGRRGLATAWPAAVVAGVSFATVQFLVSNLWGPYATDVLSSLAATVATVGFLKFWSPRPDPASARPLTGSPDGTAQVSGREAVFGWLPWALMSAVMIAWSYFKLFPRGQALLPIPGLHDRILISLYQKPYAAVFAFQPLAGGTAVLVTVLLTAMALRASPRVLRRSGLAALKQLRVPGPVVLLIVSLSYLYNYSGMAYTLGAGLAATGFLFPFVSAFLGWVACFLSGSDTSSNLLFGNLQVAAANQLNLNPVLLAATNSSGGVAGKMISPQNIAVGVTTVGLAGAEGQVLRSTFWHSIVFAALIGALAFVQAYLATWMVP
jgi:lactate permease